MRERESGGKEIERESWRRERGAERERGCLGALICFPLQGRPRIPSVGRVLF